MSTLEARLRAHPIFAAADPTALAELAERSNLRPLAEKEVPYRFGDAALAPNAFGEKTIIAESSGAPRRGYPENTMAMRASELVEIPAEAYLRFLTHAPATVFELLRDICCRFTSAAFREVDVMLPVSVRLASLLVSYAEADGKATPDGIKLRLPFTHEDLAKGLGVATKSISRTLREWAEADLVVR